MSIYRLEVNNLSRGKQKNTSKQQATHGKESNACAAVAYITARHITCERTGKEYYYGRKNRVAYEHTFLPKGASKEWEDPSVLWNEVENYETGAKARLAKKFMGALPNELTLEQCKEVVTLTAEYLNDMGYPVTAAIHVTVEKNKPQNIHAHFMATDRRIDENGQWLQKQQKEYELDNDGNRVPLCIKGTKIQKVDSHGRKQWKRITIENNPIDDEEFVPNIRKLWEDACNQYLDEEHKISRLSNKARGLDRIPTVHVGYGDGKAAENNILNQEIENANYYIDNANVQKVKNGKDIDKDLAGFESQPSEEDIKDHKLWVIVCHHIAHIFDPSYNYENDPVAATHIVSDSPIINDLQHFYIKAAESDYDEITASSLQALAKTVVWLQKHDCLSTTAFAKEKAKVTAEVDKEQAKLDDIKAELKDTNLQIKYMGIYLTHKKSKDAEYWNAVSILRKAYPDKFPSMNALKEKRIALSKEKETQQAVIKEIDKNAYKLGIIEHNLNVALGRENIEKRYDRHIQKEVKTQEPVPVRKVAEQKQEQPVDTVKTAPTIKNEPTIVKPTPAQPSQTKEPVIPSYYGQYDNFAFTSTQNPPRVQTPQPVQPPKNESAVPTHEDMITVLFVQPRHNAVPMTIENSYDSILEIIKGGFSMDAREDGANIIWDEDNPGSCLILGDTDEKGMFSSLTEEQLLDYEDYFRCEEPENNLEYDEQSFDYNYDYDDDSGGFDR